MKIPNLTRCSNNKPDSLSVSMVTKLGWCDGAIWDGDSLRCCRWPLIQLIQDTAWYESKALVLPVTINLTYGQRDGEKGTASSAHPQTARDDRERRDLERWERQEGLAWRGRQREVDLKNEYGLKMISPKIKKMNLNTSQIWHKQNQQQTDLL